MKLNMVAGAAILLVGLNAFAGPEQIIKQRAKEIRDQNNVRQGVAPPTQLAPRANSSSTVQATPISPTLLTFQEDLGAIKTDTPPTSQKRAQMIAQIIAAAQTANKPSQASVGKFVDDLVAAIGDKALPASSRTRFGQELDAILNPGKYPQAQLSAIFTDAQAILQANGSTRAKAVAVCDDLKVISGEVLRGAGK